LLEEEAKERQIKLAGTRPNTKPHLAKKLQQGEQGWAAIAIQVLPLLEAEA
jgi:hypothetical protein